MIQSFHAHIYYDPQSREVAAEVREAIERQFTVTMGRWHDKPVGPHPQSMYQVAFEPDQYSALTQWLMLNRRDLTVLVHPNTGDDIGDHRDYPFWMGRVLPLDLEKLT